MACAAHVLKRHDYSCLEPAIDPTFFRYLDPVITVRWVLTPFSAPYPEVTIKREIGGPCGPVHADGYHLAPDALVCDAAPGDILYLPRWWHETCNFDAFTLGISGFPEWAESMVPKLSKNKPKIDAVLISDAIF